MTGVSSGGGGGAPKPKPPAEERPVPLFIRFAVPKEWRTKDSGTA